MPRPFSVAAAFGSGEDRCLGAVFISRFTARSRGFAGVSSVCFFGARNRDHPIVIMKENIQKRTVDAKIVSHVVVDKSQLPESVHEEADAGTCGPDHLCQRLLTQSRN